MDKTNVISVEMERHLNKMFEEYIIEFKENIKKKLFEMPILDLHKANEFMEYIYDYDRLVFKKEDIIQKKKSSSGITSNERCIAIRNGGERCTRRRKKNSQYCGTHSNYCVSTEFTESLNETEENNEKINHLEVFVENIGGIMYYIDNYNNVYKTEDIMENKKNPQIIAKCVKDGNVWKIPEFGI